MKPKFFIGYRTEAKIVLNIEEKLNQEIVSLRKCSVRKDQIFGST